MTDETNNELGHATIQPTTPVVAGSFGTWKIEYKAGPEGLGPGSRIRISTDTDSDWGIPQFTDSAAAEYSQVAAPNHVTVSSQTVGVKTVVLTVVRGRLEAGEKVTFNHGETSGGGPGSRAQTFADKHRYFRIDVDKDARGKWQAIAEQPQLSIIGGEAVRLIFTAPSEVEVGEAFRVLVKAEDVWGNPSHSFGGTIKLAAEGVELPSGSIDLPADKLGAAWIEGFKATQVGTLHISGSTSNRLAVTSNPIRCVEKLGEHRLYWADPHGGQLVMNTKFSEFFRYGRDVSGVQFVGFQRNADVLSKDDYEVQQHVEIALYEPGVFVPIPGFEWSGRVWEGGHHNVYFRRHNQPVWRNAPAETDKSVDNKTELPHILDVYRHYRGSDITITTHVGGEHSNLEWHEPSLEPAVEIVSSHGMFEWILRESLERGYRMGFIGGSDSYTGRPGDDRPGHQMRRYSKAGLTGIYTEGVTIEAFHEAMRAKRVYATTGARMIVKAQADGHFMGSEYTTSEPPKLTASVTGTNGIESIQLYRGLECLHDFPIESTTNSKRVRILWAGASRMMSYSGIIWDGTLRIHGAKILNLNTVRFDSPRSHIVEQNETFVRWHTWGCGYPMGIELELDGEEAELEIGVGMQTMSYPMYGGHGETGPRRVSFAPADGTVVKIRTGDLQDGTEVIDLGNLERRLEISLCQEKQPKQVDVEFADDKPKPGINPYWFRFTQSDQERAWSSPVFVDYAPSTVE